MCRKSFSGFLHRSWVRIVARHPTLVLVAWSIASQGLWAQSSEGSPPQLKRGLEFRNVSAYAGYYSNSLPNAGGFQSAVANFGPDLSAGGSAELGWSQYGERSSFSFTYIPSYVGRVRNSEWNALNHAFSLYVSRKLSPRWNFIFSVGADLSSQDQFLFTPTLLSAATAVPATFDDLSAAVLSRNFNNPQLASVLTSAPLAESPARNLLYGQRVFRSGAQASLSYSSSPRLAFTFGASGGRSQSVAEHRAAALRSAYLLPKTTSGGASIGVSYSLSERTQIGATVGTSRITSVIQDVFTTASTASLGRTVGRRWFLEVHGGIAVANSAQQTSFRQPTSSHPVAGGSLGFKTFTHTFLGAYDRTATDPYGVATTSSSANVGWRWSRPGRPWWLESSFSWEQLQGGAFSNTPSGLRVSTALSRRMGTHVVWSMQYAYLDYSGGSQTVYTRPESAVRVAMTWSPGPLHQ